MGAGEPSCQCGWGRRAAVGRSIRGTAPWAAWAAPFFSAALADRSPGAGRRWKGAGRADRQSPSVAFRAAAQFAQVLLECVEMFAFAPQGDGALGARQEHAEFLPGHG